MKCPVFRPFRNGNFGSNHDGRRLTKLLPSCG